MWGSAKYSEYTKDGWKLGIGYANEPKEDTHRTFIGQMPKRLGMYYRTLPFESGGNPVTETAVSAGIHHPRQKQRKQAGLRFAIPSGEAMWIKTTCKTGR
ncbi:MAG: hypothetical protein MZV63_14960 [Marinilabiliales bacterium]|nr:hypothetical protein [Marinilabiliales bacterium]